MSDTARRETRSMPRSLFLGHDCPPTAAAWRSACQAGVQPEGVLLAGQPGTCATLAAETPLTWVRSVSETAAIVQQLQPDVVIAACYPWRLPQAVLEIPLLGILNIHPSLLPLGRGAEPVFWTLRRGEPISGVTVHLMDRGLDTGPVIARQEVTVPPGVRATTFEEELMALGGRLIAAALPALLSGELVPMPQREEYTTFAPHPSPADWLISPLLPAAWAWNFARGVAPLGGPLAVTTGGEIIPVRDALAWSPNEPMAERTVDEGDGKLRVRFSPGWVRFQLQEKPGGNAVPLSRADSR